MGILARFLDGFFDLLFPPKDTARIVRELSAEDFGKLLTPTLTVIGSTSLLPYRHRQVRAAVIEAKFHKNQKAIELLALALSDYLAVLTEDSEGLAPTKFVLVPVPLGNARRRERGYNQVEEVAKASGVSTLPILTRIRDTRPQTTLSRKERLENMTGAFASTGRLDSAVTYIVLDDVVTTGATLSAAAHALQTAGATQVISLALAH